MNAIFIPFNKENSFEVEKNYVIDNYLDKSSNLGYSVVRTHLNGNHPLMKNIISNRTYYIINGNASFDVENEHFKLKQGDTLTIPKDTLYKFEGIFDAILISCPAFDEKYDVIYRD
ncbi:MAG: hypothetical protein IJA23_05715 [Clostridia bacterium]|nr:hypothetical protein [Clostridia bacterium]